MLDVFGLWCPSGLRMSVGVVGAECQCLGGLVLECFVVGCRNGLGLGGRSGFGLGVGCHCLGFWVSDWLLGVGVGRDWVAEVGWGLVSEWVGRVGGCTYILLSVRDLVSSVKASLDRDCISLS